MQHPEQPAEQHPNATSAPATVRSSAPAAQPHAAATGLRRQARRRRRLRLPRTMRGRLLLFLGAAALIATGAGACGDSSTRVAAADALATARAYLPYTQSATLGVRSAPPGATIEVDGRTRGTTPAEVPVGAGYHRVEPRWTRRCGNRRAWRVAGTRCRRKQHGRATAPRTAGDPRTRVRVARRHASRLPGPRHRATISHRRGRVEHLTIVPIGHDRSLGRTRRCRGR